MEEVASYSNSTELITDKKVNLIYGLNGTGKSTISNFLYNPENIDFLHCNTEGGEDKKFLVYNQCFIEDYFYEAENLKGVFSLSKENKEVEEKLVAANQELSDLSDKSEEITNSITEAEEKLEEETSTASEATWEIRKKYSGGDRVLEYCLEGLMGKKAKLFEHICKIKRPDAEPEKGISDIKKQVEELSGDSVSTYDEIPEITLYIEEIENNDIFSRAIVGNEDSVIAGLINELNNSDWVKQGLDYLLLPEEGHAETCPFCQQKTITKSLSEDIRGYFDKAYEDALNELVGYLDKYNEAISSLSTIEELKDIPPAKEKFSELENNYKILNSTLSRNVETIERKIEKPSDALSLNSTKECLLAVNEIINAINQSIGEHNTRINNSDSEREKLKSDFWSLMRWQYDQTISRWIEDSTKSKETIDGLKRDKSSNQINIKNKRDEIVKLQKQTVNIDDAVNSINNSLIQLGIADFSITKYDEALYKIVRNGEHDAEFSSLSEGEKMVISFLYFCELCRGKQTADEVATGKIVVIDDPISSLSHIFVFNIAQLLKTEFFSSDDYEQIFVLTHSLYFFYELTDTNHERRKENQSLYRLVKNSEGSSINSMKYEEVQNDYQSYWVIALDENQPPALIANSMRNIIEYFFNFVQKADFSNVIQKPELQENRFQAFCRYVNRESHSLGQNIFDFKEFNYDDFRDGLKLVFESTGYPEHYKKMAKVLSP